MLFSYLSSKELICLHQSFMLFPGVDPFVLSCLIQTLQVRWKKDDQVIVLVLELNHFKLFRQLVQNIEKSSIIALLLCISARVGHLEAVKFMLKKGANEWYNGMYNAGYSGSLSVVNQMIETCVKDLPRLCDRSSPIKDRLLEEGIYFWNEGLCGAAERGHLHIVERMIEMGANDWNGPLCKAASGGHFEVVDRITHEAKLKLDPNSYTELLDDAMCSAIVGGHLPIVQKLCCKGAINVNIAKEVARIHDNMEICRFLRTLPCPRR